MTTFNIDATVAEKFNEAFAQQYAVSAFKSEFDAPHRILDATNYAMVEVHEFVMGEFKRVCGVPEKEIEEKKLPLLGPRGRPGYWSPADVYAETLNAGANVVEYVSRIKHIIACRKMYFDENQHHVTVLNAALQDKLSEYLGVSVTSIVAGTAGNPNGNHDLSHVSGGDCGSVERKKKRKIKKRELYNIMNPALSKIADAIANDVANQFAPGFFDDGMVETVKKIAMQHILKGQEDGLFKKLAEGKTK